MNMKLLLIGIIIFFAGNITSVSAKVNILYKISNFKAPSRVFHGFSVGSPLGIATTKDGSVQYIITHNGPNNKGRKLMKLVNGDKDSLQIKDPFDGHQPLAIACTADGEKIWATVRNKNGPGKLKLTEGKFKDSKFSVIKDFNERADFSRAALSGDGSIGYITVYPQEIYKYENKYFSKFSKKIYHPIGIACSFDGNKVWIINQNAELYETNKDLTFFRKLKTFHRNNDKTVAVALSGDGKYGFIVTRKHTKGYLYIFDAVNFKELKKYEMDTKIIHNAGLASSYDGKTVWMTLSYN
jgi:DNA-binding beta-propeller fold protein YncE